MKKKKEKTEQERLNEKRTKRKFQEKQCINPKCLYFPVYTPTRKNQKYCCEQCQIDAGNDRAQTANKTKYKEERLLRQYDKKLQRLYEFFVKDGRCAVWIEFFRYEKIDLTKLVHEQTNQNTRQRVLWFYEYGTERDPANPDWFFIHYRPKTK